MRNLGLLLPLWDPWISDSETELRADLAAQVETIRWAPESRGRRKMFQNLGHCLLATPPSEKPSQTPTHTASQGLQEEEDVLGAN